MTQIRYTSFVCEQDALEAKLNELGAEGWRLHTCEPVVSVGPQGSGTLHTFVVMDLMVHEELDDQPRSMQSEGIAMKG